LTVFRVAAIAVLAARLRDFTNRPLAGKILSRNDNQHLAIIWATPTSIALLLGVSLKGERMGFDVLLIAVLVGGIGLSIAYVREEYRSWREQGAAQRRREAALRDLHAARLSDRHDPQFLPSVVQMQGFGDGEAANPEHARVYPLDERRKRPRQRANQ
jgi:hypothetical protein